MRRPFAMVRRRGGRIGSRNRNKALYFDDPQSNQVGQFSLQHHCQRRRGNLRNERFNVGEEARTAFFIGEIDL